MKIIFLGAQGSGKSTQAKLLSEKLRFPLIEMGQLFRDKAQESDEEAFKIKKALESGDLVNDEIVVRTLHDRIKKSDCEDGYVLDGFPRNDAQHQGMPGDIDKVFYIKVSDEEAMRRLSLRKRSDDTQEALVKRLEIYHKDTEPLLDDFRNKQMLEEIDGERSIKDIHKDVLERVEKIKSRDD